jgi:uncharacterized protein YvpB
MQTFLSMNGKRRLPIARRRRLLMPVALMVLLLPQTLSVRAQSNAVIIEGMPSLAQWYNLSCEYAAAEAVTLFWGNVVSQDDFLREVPFAPNPHKGFRGDINGPHGGIDDYGIYAEPLVPVLERRGYKATVFYGTNVARLKANLDVGFPVVAWLTTDRNAYRPAYWGKYAGETFKLVPGEHAIVVYGYDGGGVYSMDVSDGGFYYTDWGSFIRRWGYFDGLSLVIRPSGY